MEVADTKAIVTAHSLERLDAARAGFGQAVNRREDTHGDVLGNGADVGFGFVGKDDPLHAAGSLLAPSELLVRHERLHPVGPFSEFNLGEASLPADAGQALGWNFIAGRQWREREFGRFRQDGSQCRMGERE